MAQTAADLRCRGDQAAADEHRRQTDKGAAARLKKAEWEERAAAKRAALVGAPTSSRKEAAKSSDAAIAAQAMLHETADVAARKFQKKAAKESNKANSFGWQVFNEDAKHRMYERELAKLPNKSTDGALAIADDSDGLDYGGAGGADKVWDSMWLLLALHCSFTTLHPFSGWLGPTCKVRARQGRRAWQVQPPACAHGG